MEGGGDLPIKFRDNILIFWEIMQSSGSGITVGAASQRWSNERMMVYFKLMIVKC